MTRKIFMLSLSLIILLGVGQAAAFDFGRGPKGNGDLETRELSLDEFNALEVGGAFEVDVRLGKRQKVAITVDENLWQYLETRVKNQWLKVDWDRKCRPSDECRIEIVVEKLEEISVHGAVDANIHDFRGDRFRFRLSGAGSLEMDGEVDDLEINLSGAGEVDTRRLKARRVDVRISGAGNAEVYASEGMKGRVSGLGSLTYHGDPENKETSISGLGSIEAK